MTRLSLLGLVLVTALAAPARAELGEPLQVVLSNDFSAAYSYISDANEEQTKITFAPAADLFVIPHLSVGLAFAYTATTTAAAGISDTLEASTFRVEARVGYLKKLTNLFALWPRIGFGLVRDSQPGIVGPLQDESSYQFVRLAVPVLVTPVEHFFVGAGPRVDIDFGGASANVYALETVLGGWF